MKTHTAISRLFNLTFLPALAGVNARLKNFRRWFSLLTLAVFLSLFPSLPTQAAGTFPPGFVNGPDGVMWQTADGSFLADSWLEFGGLRYHLNAQGYIETGFTQIDGKVYYLYPEGIMAAGGWLQIGDGIYFFHADGTMAADTSVDGFYLGADGRLAVPAIVPSPLEQEVNAVIASVTTPEMTQEQKLLACANYVIDACSYKRDAAVPSGNWPETYALEMLTSKRGNCYRYASAIAYLAKGLGYEAKAVAGQVRSVKGGLTPHGWAEVCIDGVWYIYDGSMQDANRKGFFHVTHEAYPRLPLVAQDERPL